MEGIQKRHGAVLVPNFSGSVRGPFGIDATMRALSYSYGKRKLRRLIDDMCVGNNIMLEAANVRCVGYVPPTDDVPYKPVFGIYHEGHQGYWREEGLYSKADPFQSWVDVEHATTFESRDQAQRSMRNIRCLTNDYLSTMQVDLLYPSPHQRKS